MDNGLQSYISSKYIARVKGRIDTLGGKGRASEFNNIVDFNS